MTAIYKFPYQVDISAIAQEIEERKVYWTFDRSRRMLYEQKDTDTIALRAGKRRMGICLHDSHECFDTVLRPWFPQVNAFIEYFIGQYGGECGRIAIVRLPPDKTVVKHIDFGDYYRKRERYHLVVQGMYQYQVGEEIEMFGPGDLFWFDSQKIHAAKNMGTIDRIVVIFDVWNPDFRKKVLNE